MDKDTIELLLDQIDITQLKQHKYEINGKIFNVSEIDFDDFTRNSSEKIEDFIKRTMPKDDDELSYFIGLYIEQLLAK